MYCEDCGTKNVDGAKFCENCGSKMAEVKKPVASQNNESSNKQVNKNNNMSKKNKTTLYIVILVLIALGVGAYLFLNNPIRVLETNLNEYYNSLSQKNIDNIKTAVNNSASNKNVLQNVKDTSKKIINGWVNDFNKEYESKEKLSEQYNKLKEVLKGIYDGFDHSEYILDSDKYKEISSDLYDLNDSKLAYLRGKEYQDDNNNEKAYYYYQSVIEKDCYYSKVKDFINVYLKEKISEIKTKAEEMVKDINDDTNTKDAIKQYLEQYKYLKSNDDINSYEIDNIDDFKKITENALSKIVEYVKKYEMEVEKDLKYASLIEIIDVVLDEIPEDSDAYKDLKKIKDDNKDKVPDSLLDKRLGSYSYYGSGSSKKELEIDNKTYSNYIYFSIKGDTLYRTYRLNKDYKKFKATIVRGNNWGNEYSGEIKIYGDDKEIYSSGEINKNNKFDTEIDIDVTDIDELKIEFVTTSGTSYDSCYIYLVEPYLYK